MSKSWGCINVFHQNPQGCWSSLRPSITFNRALLLSDNVKMQVKIGTWLYIMLTIYYSSLYSLMKKSFNNKYIHPFAISLGSTITMSMKHEPSTNIAQISNNVLWILTEFLYSILWTRSLVYNFKAVLYIFRFRLRKTQMLELYKKKKNTGGYDGITQYFQLQKKLVFCL